MTHLIEQTLFILAGWTALSALCVPVVAAAGRCLRVATPSRPI